MHRYLLRDWAHANADSYCGYIVCTGANEDSYCGYSVCTGANEDGRKKLVCIQSDSKRQAFIVNSVQVNSKKCLNSISVF